METDPIVRTHAEPVTVDTYEDHRLGHVDWPAIFGGTVLAMATWFTLELAGFGVGLAAVNVDEAGSWRGSAIGSGIWGIIAPLIAFFVGGLVVGRGGRAVTHAGKIVNASVMWAFAAIGGVVVLAMMLAGLVKGAASVTTSVAGGAAKAVGTAAAGIAGQADSFGLRASDALQPVNQRLQAEGKPPVTAEQLQAAAKDIVGDAVRTGTLDRAALVSSIANETALSQADAEEVANRVQAQYEKAKKQIETQAAAAKDKAVRAAQATADATGKIMLSLFVGLVLAFIATVVGALLGGRSRVLHERVHP
jgi:hypothetical protein